MTDDESASGGTRGGVDPIAYVFLGMMILITSTTATAAKVAVRELPTGLDAARPVRDGRAGPPADRLAVGGVPPDVPPRPAAGSS